MLITNDLILSALDDRLRHAASRGQADGAFVYAPGEAIADLRRFLSASEAGAARAEALTRLEAAIQGEALVQRGLKEVVVGGGEAASLLEGARAAFGFAAHITMVREVRDALIRAEADAAVLAVTPWPEMSGAGQWWPALNEGRFRDLRVASGWPLLPGTVAEPPRIAVVGRSRLVPSGNDVTLATAHDDLRVAERVLEGAGFSAQVAARARSLALIRIEGYVAEDDNRLDAARQAGLEGLRIVGALPRP